MSEVLSAEIKARYMPIFLKHTEEGMLPHQMMPLTIRDVTMLVFDLIETGEFADVWDKWYMSVLSKLLQQADQCVSKEDDMKFKRTQFLENKWRETSELFGNITKRKAKSKKATDAGSMINVFKNADAVN